MRSFAILLLAGLLTLLVALPLAAKVLSHADYARSEPAADEVLATPPAQVKVWFTQELFRREGENWLHVTGPDGARVDLDDIAVDDNDRSLLTVTLADNLPDGVYRVEWRALSADDGHPKEGEFAFRVAANPASVEIAPTETPKAQPTVALAATTTPSSTSDGGGLYCFSVGPLALLAVGSVLIRKRRGT